MRKLVYSALALAGLSLSSGCIIGGGDPEGTFELAWNVFLDGAPSTCDDAGVAQVELLVTLEGTTQGTADHFPCNNGSGETFGLEPGFYTIQVNALDANDDAIATGAPESGHEVIDGAVTDLGTFNIDIEGGGPTTAQLDFTVDYGNAGGENCTETAVGGSGVIQQQINLYDVGGAQCLPFAISGTDDPGNTTCEPRLCQESNITQTMVLDTGSYDIEIWGLKGATGGDAVICYSFSAQIDVLSDDTVDFVVPFEPINDPTDACNATKPDRGR